MEILTALVWGIGLAIGAVGLPGLLTTTTLETTLAAGRKSALLYGAGYGTTYIAQAGLALALTTLVRDPELIIKKIGEYAIYLFLLLAVVFLIRGIRSHQQHHREKEENKSKHQPPSSGYYLAGIGVALVNFIALPYFFGTGTWVFQAGYVEGTVACKAALSFGAGIGVMLVTTAYAFAAPWLDNHAKLFTRNVNYFLVGLFLVMAVLRFFGVGGE